MRLLITGLNGLIGWNFYQEALKHKELEPHGTYRKRHDLFEEPCFHRIDLTSQKEIDDLVKTLRPEVILHSWAMCDLDMCESFPDMAYRVNVLGTMKFLKAAQNCPTLEKFIYMSTDHVFSGEKGDYHEEDVPDPKHVYGATKKKAEILVQQSNLPFLIIRPGLVIGKSAQGNKGPRDFLLSRIRLGKPTHFFTDEWRTPIAAEDASSAVLDLISSEATGIHHLAGTQVLNRYEIAVRLAENHQLSTDQIFKKTRKEDLWAHIRPKDLSLRSLSHLPLNLPAEVGLL